MLWMQGDEVRNCADIKFTKEPRIIARTEWFAENATIDLTAASEPVCLTIYRFFTDRRWPITEEIMEKYGLKVWAEDFATIYQGFFQKAPLAVKRVEV